MDYTNMSNQELEQLIEQKDMEATCEMAERCLNGTDGVEMNLNRAYQLFHRAEAQGNPRAYHGLAYMYEHGILFAQNLTLAKEYYEKAGIHKTEFAPEQVRLTNAEKVASAIAKAEAPKTVKVSSEEESAIETDTSSIQPESTAAPESVAAPEPAAPIQPEPATAPTLSRFTAATPAAPVEPVPAETAVSAETAEAARMAGIKAQEAATKAHEAAVKAQEAAAAAQLAAEYAQKACQ